LISIVIFNVETGFPTVEDARRVLKAELEKCRGRKAAIKVIHGYGSSGVGGRLGRGIRKSLISLRKEKAIKAVVLGENWSIFDPATRLVMDQCPELSKDKDLFACNPGITVVLL
jgi:hypothetical protein